MGECSGCPACSDTKKVVERLRDAHQEWLLSDDLLPNPAMLMALDELYAWLSVEEPKGKD